MHSRYRLWIVVPVVIAFIGCGGAESRNLPTGKVTGKVTYNDEPLAIGSLVFQHESGEMTGAELGPGGEFTAEVPIGKNKVLVQSKEPDQPNPDPNAMPRMLPGESRVPLKYNDFNTSGLTLDVKAGDNPFDVKLTD